MSTCDRARRLGFKIFDGSRRDAAATGESPLERDGYPKIIGKALGFPVEARIWRRRPGPDQVDAVYHPAGIWLSVRTL